MAPYNFYTASIEFFDAASGQIIAGASRTSRILPYYDPLLDPPPLVVLYPVARDDERYPSVQAEFAVLEVT